MRMGLLPVRGTAASVVLSMCGAGFGFACCWAPPVVAGNAYAVAAPGKANMMPVHKGGKSDKLAPAETATTTTVTIPKTQTRPAVAPAIPVETVAARAVSKDPAITGSLPPQPPLEVPQKASAATAAIPPSAPAPPNAQPPRTVIAKAVPMEDDGLGEIQWSSGKQSGRANAANATVASVQPSAGVSAIPSGRTLNLGVPLRDGTFYLGDIAVRIAPQGEVSIGKERLLQVVAPLLRPQPLDAIKALPEVDGQVTLDALKAAGLDFRFDDAKVEMTFAPVIDQRTTGKLSLAHSREQVQSDNLSQPAIFAAYMNMRGGANYTSHSFFGDDGGADARIGLDGAARWLDVVFENSATFDMEGGFTRGGSRLVYDLPDKAVRLSAGDVSPGKVAMQGGSDILGVSFEKSYQKLQPGASIHATGSQSFRIERPSNVDVMVNGHVAQKLHLRPGDYDLNDLPLAVGANDIALVIEDDLGQRRTLKFSVFSGRSLLAPGISQWAFSAGIASHYGSRNGRDFRNLYSDLEYDTGTPVATGYYERGLTPDVTGNVHVQADPNAVMGGAGASMQTRFGFWTLDAAASNAVDFGFGYAARVGYELVNIEGPDGVRRSFRLAADHRSETFATVNALRPDNDILVSLSAAYTQDLPWQLSGSVSGTYVIGRDVETGDRYGVDVSLARNFGGNLSAGLNAGYEQTTAARAESGIAGGFKAALRLSYRIDQHSSIDATHDARYSQSQLTYRHQEGTGIGSWSAQAELDRTASGGSDPDGYGVNGAFSYTANRADISLSQHTGLAGLNTSNVEQRSSVTAATALAFADGHVAVGRPVSNGFAIVTPHANLPESDVAIGASQASASATSDILGPALMGDVSPYSQMHVAIDVSNLPSGYDLGTGAFELRPGYKSGYALTVGSDYTVSVFGALLDAEGNPIQLLTGEAREDGKADSRVVTVFTNRAGKFAAQGLRPGRWVLDVATEPKTRFVLEIPKDTVGLFKAGTLKPAGVVQ